MLTMVVLSILLTINMLLMHFDRIVKFYYYMYRKIIKPKFQENELVMINNAEWKVMLVSETSPPYTYLCVSTNNQNKNACYFSENKLQKKTGVLKELE